MDQTKIRRDIFRHVEAELYAYTFRKREIERLREEVLYPYNPEDENIGGGKGNMPGDPTGKKGIALASHSKLHHLERVADAIDEVFNKLPQQIQQLVELKYWTTPQRYTTLGLCETVGISDRTYHRWRKFFIQNIAEILGW